MLAGRAYFYPRFHAYQIDAKFDFRIVQSIITKKKENKHYLGAYFYLRFLAYQIDA